MVLSPSSPLSIFLPNVPYCNLFLKLSLIFLPSSYCLPPIVLPSSSRLPSVFCLLPLSSSLRPAVFHPSFCCLYPIALLSSSRHPSVFLSSPPVFVPSSFISPLPTSLYQVLSKSMGGRLSPSNVLTQNNPLVELHAAYTVKNLIYNTAINILYYAVTKVRLDYLKRLFCALLQMFCELLLSSYFLNVFMNAFKCLNLHRSIFYK